MKYSTQKKFEEFLKELVENLTIYDIEAVDHKPGQIVLTIKTA